MRSWKTLQVPRRVRMETKLRYVMIPSWSSVGSVGSVGDGLAGASFMVSNSCLFETDDLVLSGISRTISS